MTSPQDPPPPPVSEGKSAALDYHQPAKKAESTGCLVVSVLLAIGAAVLLVVGMMVMPGWAAAGTLVGTLALIGGGVLAVRRWGFQRASAIAIVAVCVALLSFGLCAGSVLMLLGK
jgi:hypothetical protein